MRNKGAEICEKYLTKGDKVYIEGRLKTRKWQDDKGLDRYSTEIHCNDFTFLSTKSESQNNASQKATSQQPVQNNTTQSITEDNDDLPF